jgi:hypothetical protein
MKALPIKVALGTAIVGYCVAIGLWAAPSNWHPTSTFVFTICPPAVLTITVDPSLLAVVTVLAPLNALLYGIVGLLIGFAIEGLGVVSVPD